MKAERIDTATADQWHRLSNLWREASERLEQIRLELLTELNITEGRAVEEIEGALEAVQGNAYMFAPQSEWTGGDSSDPNNFKWNAPHITTAPSLKSLRSARTGLHEPYPADLPTIVSSLEDGMIVWSRKGNKHQVRYGLQVKTFTTDWEAVKELGECIQHFARCESRLD